MSGGISQSLTKLSLSASPNYLLINTLNFFVSSLPHFFPPSPCYQLVDCEGLSPFVRKHVEQENNFIEGGVLHQLAFGCRIVCL